MIERPISILKSLWSRMPDGRWGITDLRGLELTSDQGDALDYFKVEGRVELMTQRPGRNVHQALTSFGSTDFLMKQSILPVVAWLDGANSIRCVGTASVISCSGYLLTAAHVLLDPYDEEYGATREGDQLTFSDDLNFGVFVPTSPAYGRRGLIFLPFVKYWLWGRWRDNPLFHEKDSFDILTDIAICKIPELPHGVAHQPLSLSLNAFAPDEDAYSIGFAEMADIPIEYDNKGMRIRNFTMDIYASVGKVTSILPENHLRRDVPTPGPCFTFDAKIPGKMSGGPIFGARGAVVRGVVSRSWNDNGAYGAMLGPAMHLSLDEPSTSGRTLKSLLRAGTEGIAEVHGVGL